MSGPAGLRAGDLASRARERGGAFTGERVAFVGRLDRLSRRDAEAVVRRGGGSVVKSARGATLVVVADVAAREEPRGGSAPRAAAPAPGARRLVSETQFCERAGLPTAADLRLRFHALADIRALYPELRDDRLRSLERWGLVRPAAVTRSERYYSFDSLSLLARVHERLQTGVPLRRIVRGLLAERKGQLALELGPRNPAGVVPFPKPPAPDQAEDWFRRGYELEREAGGEVAAARCYARALEIDPELVPALINLGNIHYSAGEPDRARELYVRAAELGGDSYFQIAFNLGNLAHDRGEYDEARRLYERALGLAPDYADAHFYLALTLEKLGLSRKARPHWARYRALDPSGEWAPLALRMELTR